MTSKAEQVAARVLRSILEPLKVGDRIDESPESFEFQAALERFLPDVLSEVHHREWGREAFDGFDFAIARKTGSSDAYFLGLALIISDQTWTPVRLHLRLAGDSDTFAFASCDVGGGGPGGGRMTRLPANSGRAVKLFYFVEAHGDEIDWAYSAVRE